MRHPTEVNTLKPATIFLDRDGVINENKFVNAVEDFKFIDGSLKAIRQLVRIGGHPIFIITNQGGIEAKYLTIETLNDIHTYMVGQIIKTGGWIQDIFYCPHLKEVCECRKPKIGMLTLAKQKHPEIDFNNAYFVGDYITDWQCATNAGITPIAVKTGRFSEQKVQNYILENAISTFDSLLHFTEFLLNIKEK